MGLFSRPPKPDFAETEMSHAPNAKRGSIFGGAFNNRNSLSAAPDTFAIPGEQQTSFLGLRRASAITPAFIRKASLAVAETDRDPTHIRMGETRAGIPQSLGDHFYDVELTLDAVDDDEMDEVRAMMEAARHNRAKGKGRAVDGGDPSAPKPGWDAASVAATHSTDKTGRSRRSRRRKQNRGMRKLDNEIDQFNKYAQNGLTPLTLSRAASRPLSRRGSDASHTSKLSKLSLAGQAVQHASNVLSAHDAYLPRDDVDGEAGPRAVLVGDGFDSTDVMADHIFRLGVTKKKWFKPPKVGAPPHHVATGVTIRVKTGLYRTFPVDYEQLKPFETAIMRLNPEIAIKIKSEVVGNIMRTYIDPSPSMSELLIDENTRIQILDEVEHLARARKHQYAAFIRSEGVLVVWADHVENVMAAADALEEALIQFIWRGEDENRRINQAMLVDAAVEMDEKEAMSVLEEGLDGEDVEARRLKRQWKERPIRLIAPVTDGGSIIIAFCLLALGLRTLVKEFMLDGGYVRFALVAFFPLLFAVSTFACQCVVGSVAQTFGPIRQVTEKSRYFSGVAPKRTMGELPLVTVQLPVYKESLEEVLMPTVESLKKAITTYERQGGSVSVLVCDDGLQLLAADEADKRRRYYYDNNLAFVARPGHNVDGFVRKGRFKKAGNMNYAIALSLRVEEVMDDMRPAAIAAKPDDHFWSDYDEGCLYDIALQHALDEREGKAWAGGNIRFGSVLLIIDSDTRVPEDCFADAVSEMAESPEVAIIQHLSGVMQVANHYFEDGVAHFTRGIQHAISYCCASGEVAPFVGHNAFLRWSALQECMFVDPEDGVHKIWSEDHVSEDFQIALALQMKGYTVRWATYSNGDFQEGVSLTCDDELNRWQKYAFGCSELVFNPLRTWFYRGPFTPLFRSFLWSNIPLHSKYSISAYIFSYWAIACAWLLTVANYFLVGFAIPLDGYYLSSWDVTLVCIVLFVGLCNVSFIALRYRLKLPGFSTMAWDQIKWIPFFSIFFTGMSMPIAAALVSHLVGYNMQWSTTVKTVQRSNFFLQLPIIWRRFWPQLVFFSAVVIMVIFTSSSLMPVQWRVHNIEVFVPMAITAGSHLLWPFALNPWFLSFSF
ncbi:hypothetical protein Q5752_000075 [Cryptotrichosporon argae]